MEPIKYAAQGSPKASSDGETYDPDDCLKAAVNVAILLRKPLLVTGEPGTGKTSLAKSVAADLGLPLVSFFTKSVSESRDLLYAYDAIGHFRQAQLKDGSDPDPLPHLRAQALGEAILRANPPAPSHPHRQLLPSWGAAPTASVVLIDEIDKAPRDFPNDLLREMGEFKFDIPELKDSPTFAIAADPMKPIVIVTSNSEKNLPDAFLRRCVYHEIKFPTGAAARKRMEDIVMKRVTALNGGASWLPEAVDFFFHIRENYGGRLAKKPATGELLDLARVLQAAKPSGSLRTAAMVPPLADILGSVFKTGDDLELAVEILKSWKAKV